MGTPLVTLVTINFNGLGFMREFLESVLAQDFPLGELEVLVVDNGSTDGSVPFIREHFPAVRVLELGENTGFARANNLAAEAARGHYLALLNNDMRLEPDWLSRMVAHREQAGADVACVGSRILNWDGTQVDFIQGTLAFHGMGSQTAFGAPVDSREGRAYPQELLFACGGALLIDRAVFLRVGGFDADYFAYFEDVDLGWRLWVLGYRVGFCPGAVAYHHHNGTSAQFGWHRKLVLFERNALYTLIKNYDDQSLASLLPAALLLAFKRLAVRAEAPRELFRFELPQAPEAVRMRAIPRRALHALRVAGPRLALKQLLIALCERFLARYRPVDPEHISIRRNGYATVVGLEDLAANLPALMEKRRLIQAGRRRTDAEILALFKTPLDAVDGHPDYCLAHASVVEQWGVDAYFQSLLGEAPGAAAAGPPPAGQAAG